MSNKPHIVVVGNEKGGSGKSTVAMHLIVALLAEGFRVGSIDLDSRQGTLTRYVENRRHTSESLPKPLPMPEHIAIERSRAATLSEAAEEEAEALDRALRQLGKADFIVMDTPGSDNALSRRAHAMADTLVTPLNDSFLDLDLLGRVDRAGKKVTRPSIYAEMVWDQRKRRAAAGGRSIDWVVLRNRLTTLDARNKREIARLLSELSKRIGFRIVPGFTERVIFRELFPRGLTLLDLPRVDTGVELAMSHLAARQEIRDLVSALKLPGTKKLRRS
ncbi:MAG TPA: division plane positioning ATPase MipZ [Candidatus Cybelea sp.]|nr:division plane positioning ATPase MipZ [Candidatus Cybelea sp.]